MIKMKALRSFGVPNANEGHVRRGREFGVANEYRAKDLENRGLAYLIETMAPQPVNRMVSGASNEAAAAGPLASPGGKIGVGEPALSLHPALRRRGRLSKNSKAESQS